MLHGVCNINGYLGGVLNRSFMFLLLLTLNIASGRMASRFNKGFEVEHWNLQSYLFQIYLRAHMDISQLAPFAIPGRRL